jgi:hypothetical protein
MYEITPYCIKQTVREPRKERSANAGDYLSIEQRRVF